MKVLYIPNWTNNNPYLNLLAGSLKKKGIEPIFGEINMPLWILRTIKYNWKPDILHIHWPDPYLLGGYSKPSRKRLLYNGIVFILELIVVKLLGIKIVWTVHELTRNDSGHKRLQIFFLKFLARLANKIVFHTAWAGEELKKVYNYNNVSKFNVIPHANYRSVYENKVTREKARQYLNINENDKVFLFFGSIRPFKGIDTLIENFVKLSDKNSKLFIVGSPINETREYANKLKEKYINEKNIIFEMQYIDDNQIQYYMNMADFMVLPYKHIFSSGCVILALTFGTGIIAPSIDSIPEILSGTRNVLYDLYSDEALLNALKRALKIDTIKLSKENFELGSDEQYQWSYSAEKYKEIYFDCFNKKFFK